MGLPIANLLKNKKKRKHFKKKVVLHAMKDMRSRLLLLAGIIALHTGAMVWFEDLSWWSGFWLTMTSASTTGYGDISAATVWGQAATIFLIYGIAITLLAQIASDYIELRIHKKEMGIKGQLEWENMQDHLLIVNTPKLYTVRYLDRLIGQLCQTPEISHTPIQILTPHFPDGLPMSLRGHGVVHHTGDATDDSKLEAAGAERAKYIVVLCPDSQDIHSDSIVFDILHRIRELNSKAYVLAEAVDDANRKRFRQAGANAVIRPVRAYPEMLVRSLIAPGTEQVLEELFRYEGDHTLRLNIHLNKVRWSEVVTRLIQNDIGTALGYESAEGEIVTHPDTYEDVSTNALIILVKEGHTLPPPAEVQKLFA